MLELEIYMYIIYILTVVWDVLGGRVGEGKVTSSGSLPDGDADGKATGLQVGCSYPTFGSSSSPFTGMDVPTRFV